jgi:hypothetical protein
MPPKEIEPNPFMEIKPNVFIDPFAIAPTAIAMATCIREPERHSVAASSDTKLAEQFVLILTLCNESTLTITDVRQIAELCAELGIKQPTDWKKGPL